MSWITALGPELPDEVCDAAVILVGDKLYVMGGFKIKPGEGDVHYYMEPQCTLWILDTNTLQWEKGPELPNDLNEMCRGYARGSAHLVSKDAIVYSGGVRLKKNIPQESNQVCTIEKVNRASSLGGMLFRPILVCTTGLKQTKQTAPVYFDIATSDFS